MIQKIKIEDMSFTGEQLSMAIMALDEMDILMINDFEHIAAGRGICTFITDSVDIERNDDGSFRQMTISKVEHIPGRYSVSEEIFLEYPGELDEIPGLDVEKFCYYMFESDDRWSFDVEFDYSLTEALYEFNEVSGPYFEPAATERMNIRRVVIRAEHDDFDVTEFVNEDVKKMLFDYCRDYVDENAEFISD